VLAHVGGHASAPAKPHDSGVFDHGGVGYLSCAQGYFTSYSGGGIHRGVHGSLRMRIRCAIPSILEGGRGYAYVEVDVGADMSLSCL
jgi:hypothetical protein